MLAVGLKLSGHRTDDNIAACSLSKSFRGLLLETNGVVSFEFVIFSILEFKIH